MHKLNNAILSAALLVAPGTISAQTHSGSETRAIPAGQVSFYEVPLACHFQNYLCKTLHAIWRTSAREPLSPSAP